MARTPRNLSHAQMLEVLASHTPPVPAEAAKPQALIERPAALGLEWMEPVKHGDGSGYQLSTCGRYSVAKTRNNGEWLYQAFIRLPSPRPLATEKTAQKAREAAEAHAR
jgi:hypothetical protein